jgi:hypothetical protein
MESPWTEEAKAIAAQVWCQPTTESIQFDPRLATEFAKTLAIWMETAAGYARDREFYCGLLVTTASHLGPEVFVSDDGSIQDEPLLLKIPEIVGALASAKKKEAA